MKHEAPLTLLMGAAGSGKTYSIITQLLHPRIEQVFVFGTEPRFMESIRLAALRAKADLSRLHYAHVFPSSPSWTELDDTARKIHEYSHKEIVEHKAYTKEGYDGWRKMLGLFYNFKCECCNKEWGPVDEFPNTYFFNIDSLTGVCKLARDLAVGSKPLLHQADWGLAQQPVIVLLDKLSGSCQCFVNVIGHLDRRVDQISGEIRVTALTLGEALTPKIILLFSEIILAQKDERGFTWSTLVPNYELKQRTLPHASGLDPSFIPIINAYFTSLPEEPEQEEAAE